MSAYRQFIPYKHTTAAALILSDESNVIYIANWPLHFAVHSLTHSQIDISEMILNGKSFLVLDNPQKNATNVNKYPKIQFPQLASASSSAAATMVLIYPIS